MSDQDQKVISFTHARDRLRGTSTKEIVEWLESGFDDISEKTDHNIRAHYLQRQFHVEGKELKDEHPDADPRDFRVFGQDYCNRNKK